MAVEAPLLTGITPWIASGHVESFADKLTECEKCGEAYRADHLVEEKLKRKTESLSLQDLQELITKNKVTCPKCSGSLGRVYDYNMMFRTFIGPGKNKIEGALRPETAQTTYMPFKRLFEIGRKKLPMGVIQLGKSFRNEISPRKALVRLREFTQAEIQFFTDPQLKNEWKKKAEGAALVLTKEMQKENKKPRMMSMNSMQAGKMIAYFLGVSLKLYEKMGIDTSKLVLRQHMDDERSFYSSDTWDIEFISDKYGRIELVGIADRTDYDLKRHQQLSKENMEVNIEGRKFVPHVIEVAYGIDRPLLCVLESCIREEKDRLFFEFPPSVSPYQIAIFPLVKKGGLPEKAKEIFSSLRKHFYCLYDETGSIGRMYYRQDEAGTPYCVTVDYDTLKDGTVTVRDRDTQKQIRVSIRDLPAAIEKLVNNETEFEKAGKLL